jgi:TolA-binding protein
MVAALLFLMDVRYFGRTMIEFDEELRELKREIIETRGLIIKTNNLTNALSADLKSIAKRQQGYERKLIWNSATAYVVFVVVVFVALKLAWDARVDAVRAETEQTRQAVDRLSRELKEAQKRDEDRAKAEARAASFYDLIRQGKRSDVVEQFEALNKEPLTKTELAFFADAVDRARGELSIAAYHQGLDHARVGRWHEAAQSLEESLRYKDDASHSPLARYNLADAYRHLARQRDAIPLLIQLSEASPDKEVMDDATFLLSQCLIDIQAWNDAKNTLRSFSRRFSDSPYMNQVRSQLADISLHH